MALIVAIVHLIHIWDPNRYNHSRLKWGKDNEGVLYILQSSRSGASPSYDLASYSGHSLGDLTLWGQTEARASCVIVFFYLTPF